MRSLLLACLAAASAQATTLQYLGLDPQRSTQVWLQVTYPAGSALPEGGHVASDTTRIEAVDAGVMRISIDGLQAVDAFCIDFFAYLNSGIYDVNVSSASSVDHALRAGWLVHNTLIEASGNYSAAQVAAALQIAIWDVVNDGGDGFAAGLIQLSKEPGMVTDPEIAALAALYLNQSQGQSAEALIYTSVNGPADMQRVMTGVPEPSTWSFMAVGAAAVLIGSFRRRRKS